MKTKLVAAAQDDDSIAVWTWQVWAPILSKKGKMSMESVFRFHAQMCRRVWFSHCSCCGIPSSANTGNPVKENYNRHQTGLGGSPHRLSAFQDRHAVYFQYRLYHFKNLLFCIPAVLAVQPILRRVRHRFRISDIPAADRIRFFRHTAMPTVSAS